MARGDFSYSTSRQRKKGHFKLFSDDLPPITFNSALLQQSLAGRRTKDRKDADIFSLPPIDRREADLLSESDQPRAKSQSPLNSSNVSRRGRQRARQHGLQKKEEDLVLPDLPTPPDNRRQRRVSPESGSNRHFRRTNWGYIRPDKDTTGLQNTAVREHDLYRIYTRKKPTSREVKAKPRTFDESPPLAIVRSPKIRSNEQVTILIHNQSDADHEVISITHSLQSGSKLLRRKHRREDSVQNSEVADKTMEATHDADATMSQETQGHHGGPPDRHRGGPEGNGLHEYESYLSRLNESLNECHRHGNTQKERVRRPKQGSGNSSLSSAKTLPPINETKTEAQEAKRQTVSQSESGKRVTVEDPTAQHLRMPWYRRKANEDMLKSQQRKPGHENVNTDASHVPPAPKSGGKKSKKRRRQRRTSPSQPASDKESTSTGELLERSELDPTEYLLQHIAEEDIDRSMTGVELLKFYRLWDRKRKKFPSGLRKITAPDIRKPDETLSSVITFAKSFKALRERKGSQDITPLVEMAE